jgi:hypothetical protein
MIPANCRKQPMPTVPRSTTRDFRSRRAALARPEFSENYGRGETVFLIRPHTRSIQERKENGTMKRFSPPSHAGFTRFALGGLTLCALSVAPIGARQSQPGGAAQAKVMHEFRGIKLGLKQAQVQAALGKPESASAEREEYKLGDEDLLTVHYDNGAVRAIQLYFTNPKNAPAWADVVGDAEVVENANGAKHARVVVRAENFWVSMYQSKDRSVTTITISR